MREQLTRKDVEKIEQEIEHRKLVVRKEAIEAVKEARAQGDLSENFESTSWSLPSVEIPWRTVSALNPLLEKHFGDIASVTGSK